jgi:hypothetical protein
VVPAGRGAHAVDAAYQAALNAISCQLPDADQPSRIGTGKRELGSVELGAKIAAGCALTYA